MTGTLSAKTVWGVVSKIPYSVKHYGRLVCETTELISKTSSITICNDCHIKDDNDVFNGNYFILKLGSHYFLFFLLVMPEFSSSMVIVDRPRNSFKIDILNDAKKKMVSA